MIERLLPHIRQLVSIRQALVSAEARATTVTALLDNQRFGVLHPDRRGRSLMANDRARRILGLTPVESQVAAGLAEGKSVRDMAEATSVTKRAIYWHLQQIYRKHHISRQVDLVRMMLSITEFG